MQVINGYKISKVEFSTFWGCIKVGTNKGLMFRSKKAAIAHAVAN